MLWGLANIVLYLIKYFINLEISDSESELSSDERHAKKPTAGKRPRKKRSAPVPIPVAPPAAPRTGIPVAMPQVPVMKPVPTPRVPEPRNPAPILAEQRRIEPELKQDTGKISRKNQRNLKISFLINILLHT